MDDLFVRLSYGCLLIFEGSGLLLGWFLGFVFVIFFGFVVLGKMASC